MSLPFPIWKVICKIVSGCTFYDAPLKNEENDIKSSKCTNFTQLRAVSLSALGILKGVHREAREIFSGQEKSNLCVAAYFYVNCWLLE